MVKFYIKLGAYLGLIHLTISVEFYVNPVLTTTHGRLRGTTLKSRDGRLFFAFKGIPYAKPPVGELRLEPPEAMNPWSGIRGAKDDPEPCLQIDFFVTGQVEGKEDCLYLNIFTPKLPKKSEHLLPIVFNIYGGGFINGNAAQYGPQYFMDNDVVIVNINYRLGVFGFFSTGDGLLEGNQGLKDQNMGLRWIKDNAVQFGGDPNRITLLGESSGGIAAYYHILSPMSQGLFHRAILNSGTPFGNGGFQDRPKEQARYLGLKTNCPVDDSNILIDCLKGKDPNDLVGLTISLANIFHGDLDNFGATVEVSIKSTTFLPASPNEILASGKFAKVPIIIGVNSAEGGVALAQLQGNNQMQYLDSQWDVYAPLVAWYNASRIDASEALKSYFLPNGAIPSKNLYNMTRFFSMTSFWEDVHYLAKVHSLFAPVHLFYFDYISAKLLNLFFIIRNANPGSPFWPVTLTEAVLENYVDAILFPGLHPNQLGAMHAADLPITWKMVPIVLEVLKISEDYPFSKMFVKALVDFASSSEPLRFNGSLWDQVDPRQTLCYMELKNSGSRMIDEPFEDEVLFFTRLGLRDRLSTS